MTFGVVPTRLVLLVSLCVASIAQDLYITTFKVDVTPPKGSPLCGGAVMPVREVDDPLWARGIVLFPKDQQPIVLCAVDWVGIANAAHDAWREALAAACGTSPERVAVHTLHQHDAPFADFTSEEFLAAHGMSGAMFNVSFARDAIERSAAAARDSLQERRAVTHVGIGQAEVFEVASNRRVLGPDGQVKWVRWSATRDPEARAQPVGTIDPIVKAISFWDGDTAVAVLTYYTTHPQSYYGFGHVSADFVGMARHILEDSIERIPVIHFNGASGNVTAGKYNDGNPMNRLALAARLADGMIKAWTATEKKPIAAGDIEWKSLDVKLPLREDVSEDHERAVLADASADARARGNAARELSLRKRYAEGRGTALSMLRLGNARILHMPGELFVEYQLAAQHMRPDLTVCMAAYGEYGLGYIGTEVSYGQGGYETAVYVSRTAPSVENVLMESMRTLLE
jgi:hypothetical protein